MAEQLVIANAEAFGLKASIVRLFSVYGPGLRKQLLFDICTRHSAGENTIILGGTGDEQRDWIHVDDAIRAVSNLPATTAGRVNLYNIGSGRATPVRKAANLLAGCLENCQIEFSGESRVGDPRYLVAASNSFPPNVPVMVPLKDGIASYASWFQNDIKHTRP